MAGLFAWPSSSNLLEALALIGHSIAMSYIVPGELTIKEAASNSGTPVFMLFGIGIVFPVMIGYNLYQYPLFRGKVVPRGIEQSVAVLRAYGVLLHRTLYAYCMLLPLGLVDSIGFFTRSICTDAANQRRRSLELPVSEVRIQFKAKSGNGSYPLLAKVISG